MNCEYIINKQRHQIDKKLRRQDHYFPTRLPYANKKIREIWMKMVNTTYNSSEVMINKLQSLQGKTKLKLYKNISKKYDEMKIKNIKFEDYPFAKNAQGIIKFYHEVLFLMKLLQTKPEGKNINIKYYDLYYTVNKNRDENEDVVDKNEDNEVDYNNFNDIITRNQYVGFKPRETILRWVEKYEISDKIIQAILTI